MVLFRFFPGFRRTIISIRFHRSIVYKGNLDHLVDGFLSSQLVQGLLEQGFLGLQAHKTRHRIQTHKTGMQILASDERCKVGCVVRDQHITIFDGALHDGPVFPGRQPKPGYVRRLRKAPIPCNSDQIGAQAFIDQELHEAGTGFSSLVTFDTRGSAFHHA